METNEIKDTTQQCLATLADGLDELKRNKTIEGDEITKASMHVVYQLSVNTMFSAFNDRFASLGISIPSRGINYDGVIIGRSKEIPENEKPIHFNEWIKMYE